MTTTKTEHRRFPDGTETYVEVAKRLDMIEATVRTRVYRGVPQVEITNCYCCSCWSDPDEAYSSIATDPACRNHGFAAQRACEVHHMPGQPWGDELGEDKPDYGKMPETVQQKRRADEKRWADWKAKQAA